MCLKRIIFFCVALWSIPTWAQPPAAQKKYDKALSYYAAKDYEHAYAAMLDAIKQYPAFSDAYSNLGQWYFKAHKFSEAADVFTRASASCPNGNKAFALPLARSLLYSYQPDRALLVIGTYGTAKDRSEWVLLRESAYVMKQALNTPYADTPMNLGIRINSPDPETHPCITADTMNLFFTRSVHNINDDFYRSHVDSCGGWFTARNMGVPPNSPNNETAQSISADGHYLFFTKSDIHSETGWDQGGNDLVMAYTADSVWSTPESFGGTINTPAYEGMPSLSPDNRELYFVSNREGGYGGYDIWVSRFENGLWQMPRNLGPLVNTAGDETAPFIHADNNTLYFSSTGLPGLGGSDLFYTRRINDSTWGKPQNMGYPINTSNDENSICVTIDGSRAYFSSDRDSAAGNFDIYQVGLSRAQQPVAVTLIKGFTVDSLNRGKLNYSSIYINDPKTGQPAYHYVSNRGDGSYMLVLPSGYKYTYDVDRIGYMDMTGEIDLTSNKEGVTQTNMDLALLPQGYQKPIHDSLIACIQFPINCKTLSDSARRHVQEAMAPWLEEKDIVIYINSYTDNSGNPMLNEEISYLRANLISSEVAAMGIDPLNITAKGWGEANPVAPNDSDEDRNRNRRVEVIIRR